MTTPTPSKLAILRAAGKVQREIAQESQLETVADVHAVEHANVTSRRGPPAANVDPLEQIASAESQLSDVNSCLLYTSPSPRDS